MSSPEIEKDRVEFASPSVALTVPKVVRFSFGVSEVVLITGVLSLVSFTVTIIDCSN